ESIPVRPCPAAKPTLPAPGPARSDVAFRLLIWTAVYAVAAVAVMRPVADPDLWFHLRAGQWTWEHRAVLTTDQFSSHGVGKPWLAYSWLFELLVYGLYQWLGLHG